MTAAMSLAAAPWLSGRWRAWPRMRKKRHDLPGPVAEGSPFTGAAIGLVMPERGVAGGAASLREAAEAAMQAEGGNHANSQK